ncbi:tRNA lysidine(34) synthetase TilS [Legionella massiliensis]|uniref:tRNA lysidine(34) synthetase TilS n=1 Tax=Legionella massiliensis TaxID=1034943 RepID=UPI000A9CE337|nr:tRNA lysidine(34) synthetase TilS [Legionella massiliensis]
MTSSLLSVEWLKQLDQYKRVIVGFSGGLDSTVLLHSLANQPGLAQKLLAVHINHGLSPNAVNWQRHCQLFCKNLGIALQAKEVEFARHANIEDEARKARYQVFASLLSDEDCLILGHHLNDQAETLLLQLFRGTGIDGLAAMAESKDFGRAKILRPFLEQRRQNLETYAREYQLQWIEDESNQNTAFNRNFLRHEVLPVLDSRWPAIVNNLTRTASHCQQAQSNLDDLAKLDCPELSPASRILPLVRLNRLSEARITNVLRAWFKANNFRLPGTLTFNRLISEVIEARDDAQPKVAWQGGCVRRYQQALYLMADEESQPLSAMTWLLFPQPVVIEGLGTLVANNVAQGLLLPEQAQIEIRFRQGGELFYWRGQNKHLKKLMQDWSIPPWQRDRIPLLFINGQCAAVVGYAISDHFYAEEGGSLYFTFSFQLTSQ